MKRNVLLVLGILVIVLGIVGTSGVYTVHQTQQAIVLLFGNPKRVAEDPGLHFKIPFVENVLYYERRVLNLDPPVESMLLSDQRRILVDAFARYRIIDSLEFFKTVRTEAGVLTAAYRRSAVLWRSRIGCTGTLLRKSPECLGVGFLRRLRRLQYF